MKQSGFYLSCFFLILSLFAGSCGSGTSPDGDNAESVEKVESTDAPEATPSETATAPAQADSAPPVIAPEVAAAISWMGVYTGLWPCNKCQGIDVRLKLNRDYTYVITKFHRGTHDPAEYRDKGMYTWDSTGTRLTSESIVGEKPMQFIYTEKKLSLLDENGQKYTGKLAGKFILTK